MRPARCCVRSARAVLVSLRRSRLAIHPPQKLSVASIGFLGNKCHTPVDGQTTTAPTDKAGLFGATKLASSLLVLFIPSRDRSDRPVDQDQRTRQALETLGELFGGATAYPKGLGVWRDDAQGGKLLFDKPVVIQCYTGEAELERQAGRLREFLVRLGPQCHQGAVGL